MANIPISAELFSPRRCARLVVKIGSSLLVNPDGTIRRAWLTDLVMHLAGRHLAGQELIIVSSGAIALGARRLDFPRGGRASLEDAQAAAAVGQIELASIWAELFAAHDLQAAQLLLTLDDLEDRRRYLNVAATLNRLLEAGAIPVLNENDTVATEEIRFGDNDRLAARVGQAALAEGVILLSDVDGLFTANPRQDATAQLVPVVHAIDIAIEAMAGGVDSHFGSGGMISKIQAAKIATHAGCHLAIINGTREQSLDHFHHSSTGTIFVAQSNPPAARKAWLAGRLTVKGHLLVDAGAVQALQDGKSLLAAGVRAVAGQFERGDVVDIVGADAKPLARGLVAYAADDARRITGRKTSDIEAILGYAPHAAMIHRDDLVML